MKTLIALSSRDNENKYTIQQSYMDALASFDASYIGVVPTKDHDYTRIAQMCDGLLICGGYDMDAAYFNEENHPTVTLVKENIDKMDLALIAAFLKEKKPILGICRGIQVINVYYKGSLIQDIPSQYDTILKHSQDEERNVGTHSINIVKDCFLGKKEEQYKVNSFHHQAIKKLGESLEIIAYSEDGIIEAVQNEDVIGVQWHPECMMEDAFHRHIFEVFLNKCKKESV